MKGETFKPMLDLTFYVVARSSALCESVICLVAKSLTLCIKPQCVLKDLKIFHISYSLTTKEQKNFICRQVTWLHSAIFETSVFLTAKTRIILTNVTVELVQS